jgi:hypothetical protein
MKTLATFSTMAITMIFGVTMLGTPAMARSCNSLESSWFIGDKTNPKLIVSDLGEKHTISVHNSGGHHPRVFAVTKDGRKLAIENGSNLTFKASSVRISSDAYSGSEKNSGCYRVH